MLWSKSILKRLLRLTVIFMVIAINKGDVMNLEQLTNVVKQLDATIKADQVEKSQLKSHITHLETELASVKNTSLTNEQETKNTLAIMETELASVKNTSLTNEQETKNTLAIRDRFEMFFKTSTSCSKIARLGNIESGTYNIDTDADGNEAPYEAFCKLPERTTSVGENIAYDFLHCNQSYCSEKVIEFKAPINQLVLLAEKSPACIQTVRFDCQSAKVQEIKRTQNGYDVISYLQWRDRNGDYHNFTGGNNCNNMWAQPMSDSFDLSDKSLLPVSAIRYGPLRFEWQKAKISVSKLTCEPYEDESVADQLAEMNTRLSKVENSTSFFLFKVFETCPFRDSNYILLNKVCYFFDNQARSYINAQQNCKLVFGSTGYLFEPFSNEEAKKVYDLAKPVLKTGSSDYWIGLDSIGRGANNFHYASNGAPKSQQLTSNDLDTDNFAATIRSSDGGVEDEPHANTYYSICQYTFV